MITVSTFGERFKSLRIESGHTQKSIGEVFNIKVRMIQYYERNEKFPDFKGLVSIAEYFDVSLDYLVGRTNNREINY